MVSSYPPHVHEFVKKWCTQLRDPDLVEICNKYFGTEFTTKTMKCFRYNHKYKNGMGRYTSEEYWKYQTKYPQGMYEFIRDNSWGVSSKEMAEMVNEKFGINVSAAVIKSFRQRHGIKSGVTGWYQRGHSPGTKGKTIEEICKYDPEKLERVRANQFKKGERPVNELPVGSIATRKNAGAEHKFIKVQMEGELWDRWKPLHRFVWEEHNGPIPEGMCVCFKDGDPLNCDISNLMLAKRQEIVTMAKKDLWSEDPDLTETAIYMIRLQQAANARKRGKS